MLKIYFKTTLRSLWKNKTYSFLNIFGLAIGIACAGLIFLWVEDEMTFNDVNLKKDRLYRINVNKIFDGKMFTMGSTPRPMAASIKNEIPGIANASRVSDVAQRLLFSFEDKSVYASGRYIDSSLFSMFTFNFIEGNPLNAFAQLYSLVITEATAKKFFGEEKNIVGRRIKVNNEQEYVITGVLKDIPENSSLQFEWLAPYEIVNVQAQAKWGSYDAFDWQSYGPYTYVELSTKANVTAVNRQLENFIRTKEPAQNSTTFLFPMSDWRLHNEFENGKQTEGGRIQQVKLLSLIAWIILFIACINFMNLATAGSQQRAKEIGVRKVLGAEKKGLVIRFIGEALLLAVIATIVSVIIMILVLPIFNVLMQKQLSLDIGNPLHIISLLTISVVCGLIAGSYPAIYLSSFNPVLVLKGMKIKTGGAAFIRKGLVVLQFTISVMFIIGTIIVYMQLQYVKNRNLGFDRENLIEVDMQQNVTAIFPLIKQDLLRTGLVQNVALADHTTLQGGDTDSRFKWQGKPVSDEISIAHRTVSPEFISTSGMKLVEGRDFSSNASAEKVNVIINQSMSKLMGKESSIGKVIQSPRGNPKDVYSNLTVIGIVEDYVFGNAYGKSGPVMLLCDESKNSKLVYIRTKAGSDAGQVLDKIAAVMKKNNPAYPLEYKFVDDQFNAMFFNEVLISKISGVFAALAIIISCLGLFGLAAYTAERRTKEIGIRKVLGASVAGVVGLLSKDFLQLVFISCLLAFPIAWWTMHNWLQTYEYRITISWWIFIIAAVVALLIALVTVSFQAIKAAIANPVRSLRSE